MLRTCNLARPAIFTTTALLLLLAGGGCGNGVSASPSDEAARAALESALKTWRDGGKPGKLAGTDPPVEVHDTPWSQGELLGAYEILKKEEAGATEKKFSVRLTLAKPERTEDVQYHVLGLSPVMVFRDQDYQRNINMEDGPKTSKSGGASQRRKSTASQR
ncbi:hypothetical protein BSF38_05316 [Paludisphaera borealis]|uniref:Lipoprotein n=2 Tax=Paludisphaera borealis TaxID=1387353 RepID=A0A1U7CXQ8_9BACT|nr:hypothetical protein BSF38_05316 [Paludisphaera borealis]